MVLEWFQLGGLGMYPLLIVSILFLSILIHLGIAFLRLNFLKITHNPKILFKNSLEWEEKYSILDREIQWLGNLAGIATMLGLLGTVMGIQNSFLEMQKIQQASIEVFAGGISQALSTTIFGLIIAIPSTIFMYVFRHNLDFIDMCIQKFFKE
jgi:biopolymer transport protein ExbB/TolQ